MVGRIAATAYVLSVVLGSSGYALESQQQQAQEEPPVVGPVYKPGNGVSPPTLEHEVKPTYTNAAMHAGISGEVWVDAVVTTDGRVAQPTIARSLDTQYGLDDAAIEAAKQWRFVPGTRGGQPVNTRIQIILEFLVHEGPPELVPNLSDPALERIQSVIRGRVRNVGPTQTLEEFETGAWRASAEGVTEPTLRRLVTPRYTAEAMRQKIQGMVGVDAVVMPDGTVDRARVASSLDTEYGLDDQALEAAMQSTFEPNSGTLGSNPVPVIVRLNLEFRIH